MTIQRVVVPRAAATVKVLQRGLTGPQGPAGEGGDPAWGSITGTLSSQTDLQAALDARATAAFTTIAISGQSNIVADSTADTLTIAAGTNITLTTDASTDTITITGPSLTGYLQKGADGSGSNAAGGDTGVNPGVPTGNATPSKVILRTTQVGASGASAQTLYDTVVATNGYLAIAQPGGTAGVDEGRLYDTGTVFVIERPAESGSTDAIALRLNSTNYVAVRRAQGGLCLGSGRWLTWATDPATAVPTSGLNQEGAGLIAVIDGTNTANYRDIKARDFIATRAIRLASSTVAALPTAGTAGRVAYASNGRRSGEGSGAGTGCPVWDDGTNWKTFYDNTTVQA